MVNFLRNLILAPERIKRIMAAIDDLKAQIAAFKSSLVASLTGIRSDIAELKAGLPTEGGLTAAQVADLKASLDDLGQSVADAAALDAENPAAPTT